MGDDLWLSISPSLRVISIEPQWIHIDIRLSVAHTVYLWEMCRYWLRKNVSP